MRERYKGSNRQIKNIRVRLALEETVNEVLARIQFVINSGCDRNVAERSIKAYLRTGEKRYMSNLKMNTEPVATVLADARRRYVGLKDKIRGDEI